MALCSSCQYTQSFGNVFNGALVDRALDNLQKGVNPKTEVIGGTQPKLGFIRHPCYVSH